MGQSFTKSSSTRNFQQFKADSERVLLNGGAISCPVCYNVFHKSPKILPCGHSLCRLCLKRMWKVPFLECPMCRKPFRTTSLDVIPSNYVVGCILDGVKEVVEDETILYKDENLRFELTQFQSLLQDYEEDKKTWEKEKQDLLDRVNFWRIVAGISFIFGIYYWWSG